MRKICLLAFVLVLLQFIGCSHVISQNILDIADRTISPTELLNNPGAFSGKVVILGGDIVKSVNRKNRTYIEVVQKDLTSTGKPKNTDKSAGRFLVLYEGYMDSAIYTRGKQITVAGEVIGEKTQTLDEMNYRYLLIKSKELHLIDPGKKPSFSFGIGVWKSF